MGDHHPFSSDDSPRPLNWPSGSQFCFDAVLALIWGEKLADAGFIGETDLLVISRAIVSGADRISLVSQFNRLWCRPRQSLQCFGLGQSLAR